MRSRHWAEAERAGYALSICNGSSGQTAMASNTDRPGPSVPSSASTGHGYVGSNKQITAKPSLTSLSLTTELNSEEEDYDEEDCEELPCEDGPSMADQASGSGDPSSNWGETQTLQHHHHQQQQQRQRTQMSHFQVLQLRDFYRNHRTPNRHECEALGQKLGLPHRVVQVRLKTTRKCCLICIISKGSFV